MDVAKKKEIGEFIEIHPAPQQPLEDKESSEWTLASQTSRKSFQTTSRKSKPKDSLLGEEQSLPRIGFSVSKHFQWCEIEIPIKTPLEKALENLITNNITTDCKVVIEDIVYNCHRIVLQCYSSFFDSQSNLSEFILPSDRVSVDAFEVIYKWIVLDHESAYSLIKRDNILEVLLASRFLEMCELEAQCMDIINNDKLIYEGNAFILYMLAEEMSLADVQAIILPRIQSFFLALVSTKEFVELDVAVLTDFLSSSHIVVHNELEVFMSAIRWLKFDWKNRKEHVYTVMKCVRFGLIDAFTLTSMKRNTYDIAFVDVLQADQRVHKLIDDGIAYAVIKNTNQTETGESKSERLRTTNPQQRKCVADAWPETYEEFKKELIKLRATLGDIPNASNNALNAKKLVLHGGENLEKNEFALAELGFVVSKNFELDDGVFKRRKSSFYMLLKMRLCDFIDTDFKVTIEEEVYQTHRIVLSSYSQFFRESPLAPHTELPTKKVTPHAFKAIYNWMLYDAELAHTLLKKNSILEILMAAKYLQIAELESQCMAILRDENLIKEGSAYVLHKTAKALKLNHIMELMVPRIQNFFLSLVCSKDFLHMNVDDICGILNSSNIVVNSEADVFFSAVRWLQGNWKEKKRFLSKVMSCIRFSNMSAELLVKLKCSDDLKSIVTEPEVAEFIDTGIAYSVIQATYVNDRVTFQQTLLDNNITEPKPRNWSEERKMFNSYQDFLQYLTKKRNEDSKKYEKEKHNGVEWASSHDKPQGHGEGDMLKNYMDDWSNGSLEGSDDANHASFEEPLDNDSGKVMGYESFESQVFEKLENTDSMVLEIHPPKGSFPDSAESACILVYKPLTSPHSETILLFGGTDPSSPALYGKLLYRYNSDIRNWEVAGEMPEPRFDHAVAHSGDRIYVAGGCDPTRVGSNGRHFIVKTVWSLEIKSRMWSQEIDLPTPRKNFGLLEVRGRIIAIGGQDDNGKILNTVERYNPTRKIWEKGPSITKARYAHSVAFYDDSVWVIGGITGSGETDSVEKLSINKNNWQYQVPLRYPRSYAAATVAGNELFLVGGMRAFGLEMGSIEDVDVWTGKEWKFRFPLLTPRHAHALGVVGSEILIIGGTSTTHKKALADIEVYCCKHKIKLRPHCSLPHLLSGHCTVTLPKDS